MIAPTYLTISREPDERASAGVREYNDLIERVICHRRHKVFALLPVIISLPAAGPYGPSYNILARYDVVSSFFAFRCSLYFFFIAKCTIIYKYIPCA